MSAKPFPSAPKAVRVVSAVMETRPPSSALIEYPNVLRVAEVPAESHRSAFQSGIHRPACRRSIRTSRGSSERRPASSATSGRARHGRARQDRPPAFAPRPSATGPCHQRPPRRTSAASDRRRTRPASPAWIAWTSRLRSHRHVSPTRPLTRSRRPPRFRRRRIRRSASRSVAAASASAE